MRYCYLLLFVLCCYYSQITDSIVIAFSVENPTSTTTITRTATPLSSMMMMEVPRMSVEDFTTYWQQLHHHHRSSPKSVGTYHHPLLVTPILVTGALSLQQCEYIGTQFVEMVQPKNDTSIYVELQRRRQRHVVKQSQKTVRSRSRQSNTNIPQQQQQQESLDTKYTSRVQSYNVTLQQAIDTIMTQSNINDTFWCFQEGLLEEYYTIFQPIYNIIQSTRQLLLQGSSKASPNNDNVSLTNWFDYFPKWAQSTDCVILSGIGSTSTFHRDPFEWTGTSLCIEGTKIWRFIAPTPNIQTIDTQMQSYRLPSMAWNGNTTISAGWQSDFSLYKNIQLCHLNQIFEDWSTTFTTRDEKYNEVFKIAQSYEYLQPDDVIVSSNVTIWTTVQQEGDFVVIPAHYWHQTLTMIEPTVTISSQHCSDYDLYRVLQHIVTTTNQTQYFNVNELVLKLLNDDNDPKKQIQDFFQQLVDALR